MRIKRYVSADVREAIRRIRDELGPEAVILSNKKVDGGVEISAAVDYDQAWLENSSGDGVSAVRSAGNTPTYDALAAPAPRFDVGASLPTLDTDPRLNGGVADPPGDGAIAAMSRELSTLRGMLEQQLSGLVWGEMARQHPLRAGVFQQLTDLGLSQLVATSISDQIDESVPDSQAAWRRALGLLAHQVQIMDDDLLDEGGVVALLGATGVGKTTTAAKLAARFALRHGAGEVALITTDSYRVGAHEQLGAFAQIMGIPVRVANDLAELRSGLEYYCGQRLVLIDTAGMSQRDVRFAEQAALIRDGSPLVKTLLVLSANAQLLAGEEAIRAFGRTGVDGCVISKVDESTSLGPVLSILCQHRIPAAYLTHGQRVPEDISSARAHLLVTRAVTLAQQHRAASMDNPGPRFAGVSADASS